VLVGCPCKECDVYSSPSSLAILGPPWGPPWTTRAWAMRGSPCCQRCDVCPLAWRWAISGSLSCHSRNGCAKLEVHMLCQVLGHLGIPRAILGQGAILGHLGPYCTKAAVHLQPSWATLDHVWFRARMARRGKHPGMSPGFISTEKGHLRFSCQCLFLHSPISR